MAEPLPKKLINLVLEEVGGLGDNSWGYTINPAEGKLPGPITFLYRRRVEKIDDLFALFNSASIVYGLSTFREDADKRIYEDILSDYQSLLSEHSNLTLENKTRHAETSIF